MRSRGLEQHLLDRLVGEQVDKGVNFLPGDLGAQHPRVLLQPGMMSGMPGAQLGNAVFKHTSSRAYVQNTLKIRSLENLDLHYIPLLTLYCSPITSPMKSSRSNTPTAASAPTSTAAAKTRSGSISAASAGNASSRSIGLGSSSGLRPKLPPRSGLRSQNAAALGGGVNEAVQQSSKEHVAESTASEKNAGTKKDEELNVLEPKENAMETIGVEAENQIDDSSTTIKSTADAANLGATEKEEGTTTEAIVQAEGKMGDSTEAAIEASAEDQGTEGDSTEPEKQPESLGVEEKSSQETQVAPSRGPDDFTKTDSTEVKKEAKVDSNDKQILEKPSYSSVAAAGFVESTETEKHEDSTLTGGTGENIAESTSEEKQSEGKQSEEEKHTDSTKTENSDVEETVPILPPFIPDEPEDEVEKIGNIKITPLKFDSAPTNEQPLNEAEEKVRSMSVHAHKLIRETAAGANRLPAALKEQQAAVEACVNGEAAGKVRPALIAACAFQLADMYEGYRKIEDAKHSLAIAYAAAQHVDSKGALIRSLMNFGNLIKSTDAKKPRSVRETFENALEISRKEMGISHPTTFTVKNELAAQLANTGRFDEAIELLLEGGEELLQEAERLDKEEGKPADEKELNAAEPTVAGSEEKGMEEKSHDEFKDPGSGLEHISAETDANTAAAASEKALKPSAQAKHFAMRNYLTAAALMDRQKKFEKSHEALLKAMELALGVYGENSPQHMNVLYVVGQHLAQQGDLDGAIEAHETVLAIMDETIEVYDPELLQNRVSVLRDTAILYDKKDEVDVALDYAQGALVNAQTLAKLAAPNAPPGFVGSFLETYWILLANLKAKAGDHEGAADARRQALRGKLSTSQQGRGGTKAGKAAGRAGQGKRNTSGASSTRAGGRRV